MKNAKKHNVVISNIRMSKMPLNSLLTKDQSIKMMLLKRSDTSNTKLIPKDSKIMGFKNDVLGSLMKDLEEKRPIIKSSMHRRTKSDQIVSIEKIKVMKDLEEKRPIIKSSMHKRTNSERIFSTEKMKENKQKYKDKVVDPNEIYDYTQQKRNIFYDFGQKEEVIFKKKLNELNKRDTNSAIDHNSLNVLNNFNKFINFIRVLS